MIVGTIGSNIALHGSSLKLKPAHVANRWSAMFLVLLAGTGCDHDCLGPYQAGDHIVATLEKPTRFSLADGNDPNDFLDRLLLERLEVAAGNAPIQECDSLLTLDIAPTLDLELLRAYHSAGICDYSKVNVTGLARVSGHLNTDHFSEKSMLLDINGFHWTEDKSATCGLRVLVLAEGDAKSDWSADGSTRNGKVLIRLFANEDYNCPVNCWVEYDTTLSRPSPSAAAP